MSGKRTNGRYKSCLNSRWFDGKKVGTSLGQSLKEQRTSKTWSRNSNRFLECRDKGAMADGVRLELEVRCHGGRRTNNLCQRDKMKRRERGKGKGGDPKMRLA